MARRIGTVKIILSIAFLIVVVQLITMYHFSSKYVDIDSKIRRTVFERENDNFEEDFNIDLPITEKMKTRYEFMTSQSSQQSSYSCPIELEAFHKDAKSALNRAKTEKCKAMIYQTACLNEQDKMFWKNLTRLCPVDRNEGRPAHSIQVKVGFGPPIRIMFAMVVHGRAFRQVKRLFKAIFHKNHYFYFHVDSRSDYLHRKVYQLAAQFENVAVTPWRLATIWGGASLLQMLLHMMSDTLKMKNWKWDFFINLSSACFPVKTDSKLSAFLRSHRTENFLKHHGGATERFVKKQAVNRTFLECEEHMWRLGSRILPKEIDFDGGSDWIVLNRQFVEYVVHSQDALVLGMKHFYSYSLLPAESFFHTVLRNSPLCQTYAKGNLHLTNWKRKLGCRCQYKHIVDWCGCSPNDFKPEDLVRLKSQQVNYFARKFEPIVNNEIINMLDEWLFGKYPTHTPGMNHYWENCFNIKDDKLEKYDIYMTFFQSFARIGANALTISSGCRFTPIWKPKEATYLTIKDHLEGVLTLFDVKIATNDIKREFVTLETYFKVKNMTRMMNSNMSAPANRLKGLDIGTYWDQKERIFRNVAGMLGPNDNPTLVHRWIHGDEFHVRIVWQDPLNVVAGMYQMKVEKNWVISYHKPTFSKPLRPGTWIVKIVYNDDVVLGLVKFLVIPQAYLNGKDVTLEDSVANNNGPPAGLYSNDFVIEFDRDANDTKERVKEFSYYSSTVGTELSKWVDKNLLKHWELVDTCVIGDAVFRKCGGVQLCHNTNWSSRSPDPKSELGTLNEFGRLR